jgi:predicted metal-dependent enzyme (double-stranded beta helix superfamily)
MGSVASLATLVPVLDRPPQLSSDALLSIADELASAVVGVELTIRPGDRRGFVRLTLTRSHEAWLISWMPTSGLGMHDHGGSAGAIAIASGTLAESYVDRGQRERMLRRRLHAGATVEVPANRIHEVRNPGPERALSVHVYSPPLAAMTFYDAAHRGPDVRNIMQGARLHEPANE